MSYTWVEFDRRKVVIGHDSNSMKGSMTLGEEPVTHDFIVSLSELSMLYGGCWIDQLCILQNEPDIRAALADIPSIYRTLHVVALMPGSPCSCFQETAGSIFQAFSSTGSLAKQHEVLQKTYERMGQCAGSAGLNSWFDRVWTRQELIS